MVLADDDSPAAMAGGFEFIAAVWASVDRSRARLRHR